MKAYLNKMVTEILETYSPEAALASHNMMVGEEFVWKGKRYKLTPICPVIKERNKEQSK